MAWGQLVPFPLPSCISRVLVRFEPMRDVVIRPQRKPQFHAYLIEQGEHDIDHAPFLGRQRATGRRLAQIEMGHYVTSSISGAARYAARGSSVIMSHCGRS